MTVNGTNLLQFIQKKNDNNTAGNSGSDYLHSTQQNWSAGGLFVDAELTSEEETIARTIPQLLALFGSNAAGAASQETQANEKAAEELDKSIQTTTNNTNQRVNELINKMKDLGSKLQEEISNIQANKEEQEKKQKAIEENIETIDDCKKILENPDSTSGERTAAIEKLRAAGKSLTELSAAIKQLQKGIGISAQNVETYNEEQGKHNEDVNTNIETGNQELETAASRIQQQQTTNTTTSATGVVNETTSGTAKTAAATVRASKSSMSWFPYVGAVAQSGGEALALKLDNVSMDQGNAGQTRIPSAAATLSRLSASEITRQNSLTVFSDLLKYSVGTYGENTEFAQTFYSIMEPIGAWMDMAINTDSAAKDLDKATETASEKVEEQKRKEQSGETDSTNPNQKREGIKFDFETDELKELT